MPLIVLRDGRALDETSDWIDDVNVLKPKVNALVASPARSNRSLGSDFTPDLTPISSSTPSEVDPTELRDEDNSDNGDSDNGHNGFSGELELNGSSSQSHSHSHSHPHTHNKHNPSHADAGADSGADAEDDNGSRVDRPEQQSEQQSESDQPEKVFRDYANACDRVKNFYSEQHAKQTMEYNQRARHHFHTREKMRMSVWEAVEKLNELVDDSDPDTSLSQIEHLLQTAESIRRDGKPDWMQLVGLIHDLGKLLFFLGAEGQWDVVGDTFVVGCQFSEKNIYPDTFGTNPDSKHPVYSTPNGIYEPGCGMENVMISWGHDEYMYLVAKEQSTIPKEGLAMIRFHSFYPWHRENAYRQFMKANGEDEALLAAVREFNPYDLYSKADTPIDVEGVKEYYQALIAKYFPPVVEW